MKYILYTLAIVLLFGCSEDDDPINLTANAGINQQVKPLEIVILDGSRSQGPAGFTYEWSYVGEIPESEINFEGKTTANPTFIPPQDGIYAFTLKVSSGSNSDYDEVNVVASGAVEIGGTLTEDLELLNIQPNPSLPDYIVSTDITVENGIKFSLQEKGINILFKQGVGIHVKSGGVFTNKNSTSNDGYECEFYGEEGWKGILIDNSDIFLNNATIRNAGQSTFYGQEEAATLTLIGLQTNLESLHNNVFTGSFSYDILVPSLISGSGKVVTSNKFSFRIPIKAPITFGQFFSALHPNSFPETYDYVELIPGGANKKDEVPGFFEFFEHVKYFINGDFWAGKSIEINRDAIIYMKADAGILAESQINCYGFGGFEILIEGLDGANWKGIASNSTTSAGNNVNINHTIIKNAGHGIIKMGDFEAEVPAALYCQKDGGLDNCEIINSGGYGYYNASTSKTNFRIRRTLFENTAMPAIRTHMLSVGTTIHIGNRNTFNLADGLAACLVQGDGAPGDPWYELEDDNFYLIDGDILDGTHFAIGPGTILKFKAGRSLIRKQSDIIMYLTGSPTKPVVLDSEAGTPGSWGGIYLGGGFRIENAIINNGGEFLLSGASEKANIISAIPIGGAALEVFNNTTIRLIISINLLIMHWEMLAGSR